MPVNILNNFVLSALAGGEGFGGLTSHGLVNPSDSPLDQNVITLDDEDLDFTEGGTNPNDKLLICIAGFPDYAGSPVAVGPIASVTCQGNAATFLVRAPSSTTAGTTLDAVEMWVAPFDSGTAPEIVVTFASDILGGWVVGAYSFSGPSMVPVDTDSSGGEAANDIDDTVDSPLYGFAVNFNTQSAEGVGGEVDTINSNVFVPEEVQGTSHGAAATNRAEFADNTELLPANIIGGWNEGEKFYSVTAAFGSETAPDAKTYPTVHTVGTVAVGTVSLSVPWPAVAANDIAYLIVGANSTPAIGVPTDFTSIGSQVNQAALGTRLFFKRCTGAESGSVSVTLTGGEAAKGVIIVVRGAVETGTPHEAVNSIANAASTVQASDPAQSLGTFRLALRFSLIDGITTAQLPPTGWTERLENVATSVGLTVDSKTLGSTYNVDTSVQRTMSAALTSVVHTLSVRPKEV